MDGARSSILNRAAAEAEEYMSEHVLRVALLEDRNNTSFLKQAEALRSFLCSQTYIAIFDAPFCLVFVAALFILHWVLGAITLAAMLLVITNAVIGKHLTRSVRHEAARYARQVSSQLLSASTCRTILEAMGGQANILRQLLVIKQQGSLAQTIAADRQAWIDSSGRLVRALSQCAIISAAAFLVLERSVEAGALVASTMLFGRAIAPAERLGASMQTIAHVREAWLNLERVVATQVALPQEFQLPELTGRIEVKNLYVQPSGQKKPTLRKISFSVTPNSVIVIAGNQGSGKSTLTRVLVGAEKILDGQVTIDGSPPWNLVRNKANFEIGYLAEGFQIGNGTVAEIISRGAVPDGEMVTKAAKLADADDMIKSFPQGYDTRFEATDLKISAGLCQRIALARAFYGNPRLLVLDEPTAHLDAKGEASVIKALCELRREGVTIIVVSRHPGIHKLADRLLILDQGTLQAYVNQQELREALKPKLVTPNLNPIKLEA